MTNSPYDRETLERLVKLEEYVAQKFVALDKAQQVAEAHRLELKELMSARLDVMNHLQRKMDDLTRVFAAKDTVDSLQRLVNIGLGIVMALHFIAFISIAVIAKWG